MAVKYDAIIVGAGSAGAVLATCTYFHKATGHRRRHHLHESVVQRAVKEAVRRAGLAKRASCGKASLLPHLSRLICDTSAGGWLRHQDCTGTSGTERPQNHDNLHTCYQQGPLGCSSARDGLRARAIWEIPDQSIPSQEDKSL